MPAAFEWRKIPIRMIGIVHGDLMGFEEQRHLVEAISKAIHEFRVIISFDDESSVSPGVREQFGVMDVTGKA